MLRTLPRPARTPLPTTPALPAGISGPAMILLAATCWGTIGLVLAAMPDGTGSTAVAAVRVGIGGGLFLALALLRRRPELHRLRRSYRDLGMTVTAGVAIAAYQPLFLFAITHAGTAIGAVIVDGSLPVFGGLIAALGPEGWPGRRWAIGSAGAVAGCAALTLRDVAVSGCVPSGVLAALLAGASWAVFTISSRTVITRGHCPMVTMAVAFGTAGLLLGPVLVVRSTGWLLTGTGCTGAVYLGAVATVGAYLLYGRGLRTTPAATANSLGLAEPLCAAVAGTALLGERLDPVQLAGIGALGIGLVAVALPRSTTLRGGSFRGGSFGGGPAQRRAVRGGTGRPGPRRTGRW